MGKLANFYVVKVRRKNMDVQTYRYKFNYWFLFLFAFVVCEIMVIGTLTNPSCYLPEEIEAASQNEQGKFEFKTSGSNGMDGFW